MIGTSELLCYRMSVSGVGCDGKIGKNLYEDAGAPILPL